MLRGGRARGTRRSRPDKAPDMRFLLPHRAAHFNAWLPGYLYFNWISVENATPNLTAPRNEPLRQKFWFDPIDLERSLLLGTRMENYTWIIYLFLHPYILNTSRYSFLSISNTLRCSFGYLKIQFAQHPERLIKFRMKSLRAITLLKLYFARVFNSPNSSHLLIL